MAEKTPSPQYMSLGGAAEFLSTDPRLGGQIYARDISRLIGEGKFPYHPKCDESGVEAKIRLTDLQGIPRGMPELQEELQEIAQANRFPDDNY